MAPEQGSHFYQRYLAEGNQRLLRGGPLDPELQLEVRLIRFLLAKLATTSEDNQRQLAATLSVLCRVVAFQIRTGAGSAGHSARALGAVTQPIRPQLERGVLDAVE